MAPVASHFTSDLPEFLKQVPGENAEKRYAISPQTQSLLPEPEAPRLTRVMPDQPHQRLKRPQCAACVQARRCPG